MEELTQVTVKYGEDVIEFTPLGSTISEEAKKKIEDKNFDALQKIVTEDVPLVQIGNIHKNLARVYNLLEEHPEEVKINVVIN